MSQYRRNYVPGGSYFFTVVTYRRSQFLCTDLAREILRSKLAECQANWPFRIDAVVLLPEHLHAIWSLPEGDDRFSMRWGWIKKEFTKGWLARGGADRPVSDSKKKHRRHGVGQPRFWEHTLRDEHDYERHLDYIHYNPVKHGLVERPRDWPYSSFHRWVQDGVYPLNWGCLADGRLSFDDLDQSAME